MPSQRDASINAVQQTVSITHPFSVVHESLIVLLPAKFLQEPLPVGQHGVHVSLVFDCQLQRSGKKTTSSRYTSIQHGKTSP